MENYSKLLEPVSADMPCGEDLAFSAELDAIARARQSDDPGLEQGAWQVALKEADWDFVRERCEQLLHRRSKDLQLAVWLAEANARTHGMEGLADSLELLAALCSDYWDGMHPLPDEGGHERRIGNLCWLAGQLPALAASAAPASQQDLARALDALAALAAQVDVRLGADGPGFSRARDALEARVEAPPSSSAAGVAAPSNPSLPESFVTGAPSTRTEALAQLRKVADYFRRTEPHSPVAYLADKAARWGEQPLHTWLRGVTDDAAYARLAALMDLPD